MKLNVEISADELNIIDTLREEYGGTRGDIIRSLLWEASENHTPKPKPKKPTYNKPQEPYWPDELFNIFGFRR